MRKNLAEGITFLAWERRLEVEYRAGNGNNSRAYSPTLGIALAKSSSAPTLGFFGTSAVVTVIHLHKPQGFRKSNELHFGLTSKKISRFGIDVVMGDFNMSLFKLVPEVCSRGLRIELTVRYRWKSEAGALMADSRGIFMINKPSEVTLVASISCLHGQDENGIIN